MNDNAKPSKPPLGIKPKHIMDTIRRCEILAAMLRYTDENMLIPKEWIKEMIDLNI